MIRKTFLLAAVFISGIAARADQQWVEVDSSHFSVATDGGEKRAREVAQRFVGKGEIRQTCLPLQGFAVVQQLIQFHGKFSVHCLSSVKVKPDGNHPAVNKRSRRTFSGRTRARAPLGYPRNLRASCMLQRSDTSA